MACRATRPIRIACAATLALAAPPLGAETRVLAEVLMPETQARFARIGGLAVFVADDGVHGLEPWVTDGTPEGTRLLRDVHPGPGSSFPLLAAEATNGELLFAADDGVHGRELWRTDATADGTVLLQDLRPGAAGSDPAQFAVAGSGVYFAAGDATHGRELRFIGPAGPAVLVRDLCPGACGSNPEELTVSGALLFFRGYTDATGSELGVSSGDAAGTRLIDLNPGPHNGHPTQFSPISQSRVMFAASTPVEGREVWLSDGSPAGTIRLGEIEPGTADPIPELEPLTSTVLVAATTAAHGRELWRCTPALGGFCGLLLDIAPSGSAGVHGLARLAGSPPVVLFAASTTTHGRELWRSDGTSAGTWLLRDLVPGTASGNPLRLTAVDARLAFVAQTGAFGLWQFWSTDGSPVGTRRLDPAQMPLAAEGLHALGNRLLFVEVRLAGTQVSRVPGVLTPDIFRHGFEP